MTAALQIKKATNSDLVSWDSYVDKHKEGSFFHLSGWINVIKDVFGHTDHYLIATEQAQVVGVLPLFQQKSFLFGHALVSTPFCVYGGALANSQSIQEKLEDAAYELGCKLGVDYVELRDRKPNPERGPWRSHCQHATFYCQLADSDEQILTAVKRKQRAVIRHSLNNGLEWDNSDNPSLCYDLYAESVRNLGTPVFSKRLFTSLKSVFADQCETLIIKDAQGAPVSSVLSFYYKSTVLPYYGGGTHEARSLKSNDFMYYQLMCLAREKGIHSFDFGRSKVDSGAYKYKQHWGMVEEPLHYRIALIRSTELPNLSPNNPKYRLFINMWQKMPLFLSRIIGPYLSKYLG